VVVDNKPGGNGVVAYQALLQSSPQDGHAFIVSDGSMLSITPLLNKNATYKAGVDILPVSLIARSPLFIVAHPKTGVNNFQDFLNLVKSKPGNFTYGSSGIGSTHHLTMEALKAAMKIDVRHIPFRGSGQSTPALVGGQVDFSVAALPSMQGFAKNGQVSILASNAASRSTQAPDIPAIAPSSLGSWRPLAHRPMPSRKSARKSQKSLNTLSWSRHSRLRSSTPWAPIRALMDWPSRKKMKPWLAQPKLLT
jgi:tripartite-type tricarboxylate transporter receptor subunit TctC